MMFNESWTFSQVRTDLELLRLNCEEKSKQRNFPDVVEASWYTASLQGTQLSGDLIQPEPAECSDYTDFLWDPGIEIISIIIFQF